MQLRADKFVHAHNVLALVKEAGLRIRLDLRVDLLVHFLERLLSCVDKLDLLRPALGRVEEISLALGSHRSLR